MGVAYLPTLGVVDLGLMYIPGASSECIIHVWRETHILESQPYVESADVSLDV